jgi:hypothetical protein
MLKVFFYTAVALGLAASPANATQLSIKFTNMSGDSITQLAATLKDAGAATTQNILSSQIANGDSGEATLDATESDCVFTLTFTFASGKTLNRPDTDLCQTDGIVIE